ncbi:VWA domain-containing protein [Methylovulum psychrotolerans]|uniref:VWA domain-containing protein n=1 Tax=Methylovulum psychrotolerans TaxID=1704499 RepID=A0A2S5CH35_9GAMM|nr:VWA domain-containing protein [Methylovulum psychrotolerans]POZ50133.1 VWA domain-containing protein [Methylovulum psychrotolerans]
MAELDERQKRWRLLLGGDNQTGLGKDDIQLDNLLNALYQDSSEPRSAGLGASAPKVSRWLGDIRERFPANVVRVLQKDAFERLNMRAMLLQPEMLAGVEADIHLVATLISLKHLVPAQSRDTARQLVQKLVDELLQRLRSKTEQALRGSLNRAARRNRPLPGDIDWGRTIRANLKHYQPDYKSIIPERLIGYGRKKPQNLKEVLLCVDQSGSMATSVIYASIFAAVMASIPALKTQLVVFDTAVVDLTEQLADPVEVLFGVQLGGGTDINRAVSYCQQRIGNPRATSLILITDLYEGGDAKALVARIAELKNSGVQVITLLALNDDGAPSYDPHLAQAFANLGVPTFACTPDKFPDLMATALNGGDIGLWAAKEEVVMQRQG